jgi:hypothetical protein
MLIDSIRDVNLKSSFDGKTWWEAKPLNYERAYMPILDRIKDAWRVLWCRSIAVHYKADEEK